MSNPNSAIMQSIEELDYRVTVGDIATKSGLDIKTVQPGLIQLAADTNGNLEVSQTGDIAYVFPKNFRGVLQSKYWRLRWQNTLKKVWQVVFYLIRISFGLILVSSILIVLLAIVFLVVAASASRGNDDNGGGFGGGNRGGGGGGIYFMPRFWFTPDFFWIFTPDYQRRRYQRGLNRNQPSEQNQLNFLESIYSFLFGDGNPNARLEERRWQDIGTVIQSNQGAIIAEQAAPYLDNITIYNDRDEDYMLPVLTRFNGYPEVSDKGEIVYYFPELQVTANQRENRNIDPYLQENRWQFSIASSSQKILAFFLGGFNFVLILVLGSLLTPELALEMGSYIQFVNSIYNLLIVYAISYLAIPLIRYLWLQTRNNKVELRNQKRQERASILQSSPELQSKIDYAKQFANQKVITADNTVYSTEKNLLDQADNMLNDWDKRLLDEENN